MIGVFVVDDQRLFADLLADFLRWHGFAVRTTSTAAAVSVASTHRHDVCLVDPGEPADGDPGALITGLVRAGAPSMRVIVLSEDVDGALWRATRRAGAAGLVPKTASGQDLVTVLRGGPVPIGTVGPGGDGASASSTAGSPLLAELSVRERECLEMIARGASTAEMERSMGVTNATVRSHVRSLLTKLGVHSRLAAASLALREGLVARPARAAAGERRRPALPGPPTLAGVPRGRPRAQGTSACGR